MKKFRNVFLIILSIFLLTSCGAKETPAKQEATSLAVNIGSLKGPTTIGLSQFKKYVVDKSETSEQDKKLTLMEKSNGELEYLDYSLDIFPLAEELVSRLNNKEIDLAIIPSNLAATLYNKTDGEIQALATNNLGVLHLIENAKQIEGMEDLSGKTVYTIGKGTTPDASLNYFRDYNNLDFQIEYRSEASEVAKLLATEENIIAYLPEPFVSVVEAKNPKIRRIVDMNEEWMLMNDKKPIVTSVIVARREFIKARPEVVENFLDQAKNSIGYNDLEEILSISEDLEIIPRGLDPEIISRCRLYYADGAEMKDILSNYLSILEKFDSKLIGGKLPDENFYYERTVQK